MIEIVKNHVNICAFVMQNTDGLQTSPQDTPQKQISSPANTQTQEVYQRMGRIGVLIQGHLRSYERDGLWFFADETHPPTLVVKYRDDCALLLFHLKREIDYLLNEKVVDRVRFVRVFGGCEYETPCWMPVHSPQVIRDKAGSIMSSKSASTIFTLRPEEDRLIQEIQESEAPGFIVHQASDDTIVASKTVPEIAGRNRLYLLSPTGCNMKQYLNPQDHFEIFKRQLVRDGVVHDAVYNGSIWEAFVERDGELVQIPSEEAHAVSDVFWKRSPRVYRAQKIELFEIQGEQYRVTTGVELVR